MKAGREPTGVLWPEVMVDAMAVANSDVAIPFGTRGLVRRVCFTFPRPRGTNAAVAFKPAVGSDKPAIIPQLPTVTRQTFHAGEGHGLPSPPGWTARARGGPPPGTTRATPPIFIPPRRTNFFPVRRVSDNMSEQSATN